MNITEQLLAHITEKAAMAKAQDIRIGGHWTGVTLTINETIKAGLSSTLGGGDSDHHHGGKKPVQDAGRLLDYSVQELAALARSDSLLEASVGFATINALLDVDVNACVDVNAEEIIAEHGAGKKVAIIGHFPFIPRVRKLAETTWVLELNPQQDDLPAEKAPEVLPQADVVALTGTSLLNHTFEELIHYCRPDAYILVLGGTTPFDPILFEYGVNAISGTLLEDAETALQAISQGATFPQIPGKRLLTLFKA